MRMILVVSLLNALASAIQPTSGGPEYLLPAADELHARLEDVSLRGDEVHGSVRVNGKEFDPWLARLYARSRIGAGGLNVAQARTY